MRKLSIIAMSIAGLLVSQAGAGTSFYTLDASNSPQASYLASFDSEPPSSQVSLVGQLGGEIQGTTFMDFSSGGRLFFSMLGDPIFELDPATGSSLGRFDPGDIEGLAVADTGLIYVSSEDHNSIEVVDFDGGTVTPLVGHSFDIDDMDFDSDGNLIGHNLNSTGELFRIPLDGSPVELITTLPGLFAWSMTFSQSDNAFYFLTRAQSTGGIAQLWQLPWANGQPAGDLGYVKDVYPADCYGLAAIPEPSTMLLLSAASLLVLRRRRSSRSYSYAKAG